MPANLSPEYKATEDAYRQAKGLRFARVWGQGKFDGLRIQRDQVLVDEDAVELHM